MNNITESQSHMTKINLNESDEGAITEPNYNFPRNQLTREN